jgi:hypothetical protein
MLNQFRSLYPQGSLISELIAINHGKYIVRVLVIVDGVTLASGLAAAETIEQAEDQARHRALNILNLNGEALNNLQPTNHQTNKTVSKTSSNSSRSKKQEANNSVNTNLTPPVSTPVLSWESPPVEKPDHNINSEQLLSKLEQDLVQTPEVTSSTPLPERDLSDAIAQTDIHIKRLSWSREQGRDYLLQTYGKRSRQLLSDQELLEFLHYLENQP